MKVKLTKRSVEAIRPAERDVLVWDSDIPGFEVKVTPKGVRVYVLQYSRRDRTKRVTIGRHGDGGLTADQARREAEILRGVIRDGGDPADDRARERAIPTMRALAERYMAEHALPKKKARSADSDKRLIDCHILPLLGERQVSEIARADLRRFMQDVASGKTRLDRKTGLRGCGSCGANRLPRPEPRGYPRVFVPPGRPTYASALFPRPGSLPECGLDA